MTRFAFELARRGHADSAQRAATSGIELLQALRDFLDEEIAFAERAGRGAPRRGALHEDPGRVAAPGSGRSARPAGSAGLDLAGDLPRGGRGVGRAGDRAPDRRGGRPPPSRPSRASRSASGRRPRSRPAGSRGRRGGTPGRTPRGSRRSPPGEQTTPSRPDSFARTARRSAASRGVPAMPTSARAAASSDVRIVTAMTFGAGRPAAAAASRALSPAARIISRPPPAWTFRIEAPVRAAAAAAPPTVFGMSWSFRSRKTGASAATSATRAGPWAQNASRPTFRTPASGATRRASSRIRPARRRRGRRRSASGLQA